MPGTFAYLRWSILRRLPLFCAIFATITIAAFAAAHMIPKNYQSTARVLVQLGDHHRLNPAQSAVAEASYARQALERVLDAGAVTEIAQKAALTKESVQKSLRIKVVAGRDKNTTLVLSFTDPDPRLAVEMVGIAARQLITDANKNVRSSIADQIRSAQIRTEGYRRDMDRIGEEIAAFKADRTVILPQALGHLEKRRQTLETEIQRTFTAPPEKNATTRKMVAELETSLADVSAIYSATHPQTKTLRTRLRAAQTQLTAALDDENYAQKRDALKDQLEQTLDLISQIPANTAHLATLQRDYDIVAHAHKDSAAQLKSVETLRTAQQQNRGDRMRLLDQPTPAKQTTSGQKLLLQLLGLVGAGVVAGSTIAVLHKTDQTIRRPRRLQDDLGLTPFAVLPDLRASAPMT